MTDLLHFVQAHAEVVGPEAASAADVFFFKVQAKGNPSPAILRGLITAHTGEFVAVDMWDFKEHSYLELGAWLGGQRDALLLMGLGAQMGLWQLLTPKSVLGEMVTPEFAAELAGRGMVTVLALRETTATTA